MRNYIILFFTLKNKKCVNLQPRTTVTNFPDIDYLHPKVKD